MIINGNALHLPLADESVQCCVTSPPYWGLRDYGTDAQLGLEPTPEEYVANMVAVFREVRRVLRSDGTLWLNIGDSYAGSIMGMGADGTAYAGGKQATNRGSVGVGKPPKAEAIGLKPKDLVGIPWRVAFALQADGWWLRSDIIWHKPNPMPESVRDRCTRSHEYVFMLTKSARYYYDAEAVKEECGNNTHGGSPGNRGKRQEQLGQNAGGNLGDWDTSKGRNRRDVWTITTKPFKGAHFAVMPPDLVEPCIKAGTSERGCCPACGAPWERVTERVAGVSTDCPKTALAADARGGRGRTSTIGQSGGGRIDGYATTLGWRPTCDCDAGEPVPCVTLDPFAGAGTVGLVASRLKRRHIGVELSLEYCTMAEQRIYDDAPLLAGVTL